MWKHRESGKNLQLAGFGFTGSSHALTICLLYNQKTLGFKSDGSKQRLQLLIMSTGGRQLAQFDKNPITVVRCRSDPERRATTSLPLLEQLTDCYKLTRLLPVKKSKSCRGSSRTSRRGGLTSKQHNSSIRSGQLRQEEAATAFRQSAVLNLTGFKT